MYQGNGQTEALPVAMMAPRQRVEIVGKCEGQMRGFGNNPEATTECIVDGYCVLDRADDRVISVGFNIAIEVSVFAEASVTEKELVALCAGHKIRRKELREPFRVRRARSVAGNRRRARTLARTSQEVRSIHLVRRVL